MSVVRGVGQNRDHDDPGPSATTTGILGIFHIPGGPGIFGCSGHFGAYGLPSGSGSLGCVELFGFPCFSCFSCFSWLSWLSWLSGLPGRS
ncbi:hypothetical protein [Streptomyces sp. NBC_00286]|uniref:hypothetical protein n=1 Tax=Streptomyces sp. NBC_00286 TaxID=2975701 RepID=UPI002E28C121|nr:hypothetical protein [Streptomyces sp. NBC_00286]